MAEQQEQNQTEQATPFKLDEARKRGQVAKSMEVNSFMLLSMVLALSYFAGDYYADGILALCHGLLVNAHLFPLEAGPALAWFEQGIGFLTSLFWSFVAVIVITAVLSNLLQTGPVFSFFPLKPDPQRLNPVAGFKRLFSSRLLFESLKTFIKMSVFGFVIYLVISATIPKLLSLMDTSPDSYLLFMSRHGQELLYKMLLVILLIVLIDLVYTRWEYAKRMRMSHREIKEEHKRREGDPQIRARLRELRREAAKRAGALQKLPDADVLITNPTRLAIALKYDRDSMIAPQLIAKSAGEMAAKMRAAAKLHGVPIVENKKLAKAKQKTCKSLVSPGWYRQRRARRPLPPGRQNYGLGIHAAIGPDREPDMIAALKRIFSTQSDLILVFAVVGILMILFMPIPSGLLDFLLITNISFALLILLLTFYVEKPLQFSTFPSLLLIATLFRLSLNIAATRLILSDADAGQVIATIGAHVVGGNYVIGMIVFLVLIVVQYVVVTNGAQRVAEVAARFTLDAMPGKQMSIDADLNMGLIDERQAQTRREQIEKEASFYGAMDGASKFVKGDAIAGIVIILIDIIGGLTIGIAQLGMNWGDALQTYTLLTIGDGIVTQIPALVIATGTGIIVTRAASDAYLSQEITGQVTAFPKILALIGAALVVTLFLPGIPALPVVVLIALVGVMYLIAQNSRARQQTEQETAVEAPPPEADLYETLAVEPLEIKVGQNLVPLLAGDDSLMMDRIAVFRKQYAQEIGFVMPRVRARDDKSLPPNAYQIRVYDARVGEGEILIDRTLAINPGGAAEKIDGVETRDPTYKLPAVWIVGEQRDSARGAGYTLIEPLHVLMTHVTETVRQQAANLLTRAETERLLEHSKTRNASLVEELIPAVLSLTDVQKVLQRLLREKVSIRNLEMILEILVDEGKQAKDPDYLTEVVRQRLGAAICQPLIHRDGKLNVLVLDPGIEQTLAGGVRAEANKGQLVVEPRFAEQVIARISAHTEKMLNANMPPVLLCAPELRAHLRRFTERIMPQLSILSMNEVPTTVDVKSFAMVTL